MSMIKSHGRLVAVMASSGISIVGSRMTFVAIPWLVLITTGSPAKMGVAAAAEMLMFILASALGGALVDRIGVRNTAIYSDLVSAGLLCAIAASHKFGFGLLVVLVAVAGGLRGLGDNSRRLLIPPLAAEAGAAMPRVYAAFDGMSRLSMMLGASLAGIIIAATNASVALVVDAVSFVLAASVVALFAHRDVDHSADADAEAKEPYLKAVGAGFVYVWRDRVMFGILSLMLALNLFNQASGVVFVPLWADKVAHSATAFGFVLGALGLGAVLGNIAFTIVANRVPKYATLTLAFLIGGPPRFLILGLSDDLATVLVVTFISGVAVAAINPILGVVLFGRTQRKMWARVFGLNTAVAGAGIPLGSLLGGWSVQWFGLTAAVLVTGVLYLLTALIPIIGYRHWRTIDDPPLYENKHEVPEQRRPQETAKVPT